MNNNISLRRATPVLLIVSLLVLVYGVWSLISKAPGHIRVDTFLDIVDTNYDGCSLRMAILAANNDFDWGGCSLTLGVYGDDVIVLPAGTYLLTRTGDNEDYSVTGDLDIRDNLTINGTGLGSVNINAGGSSGFGDRVFHSGFGDRVFHILPGAAVELNGLTISGGYSYIGGGIYNAGSLIIKSSVISDNQSYGSGGGGGGIYNSGIMEVIDSRIINNMAFANTLVTGGGGISNFQYSLTTITDSTISDNFAAQGGGIFNQGATSVINSTISGNTASIQYGWFGNTGGGVANGNYPYPGSPPESPAESSTQESDQIPLSSPNSPSLTITNSTISNNIATLYGGGIFNHSNGSVTITYSTMSGNLSQLPSGGSIYSETGVVNVDSSIIAGANSTDDCSPGWAGTITSLSGLTFVTSASCVSAATGFQQVGDVMLGPLADNSGPTQTHALLPGSPAIDVVSSSCPATDQRGQPRPQDGDLDGTFSCDSGAFEVQP